MQEPAHATGLSFYVNVSPVVLVYQFYINMWICCDLYRFQMDQLPCAHAIAVLQKVNHDPYDYCSPYFKKEAMVAAYEQIVYPVGHKDTWEVPENIKSVTLYPPEGRIRVGRTKKRRCKAAWEKNVKEVQQIKCSNCNQYGHNRRTCRNPPKRNI